MIVINQEQVLSRRVNARDRVNRNRVIFPSFQDPYYSEGLGTGDQKITSIVGIGPQPTETVPLL